MFLFWVDVSFLSDFLFFNAYFFFSVNELQISERDDHLGADLFPICKSQPIWTVTNSFLPPKLFSKGDLSSVFSKQRTDE